VSLQLANGSGRFEQLGGTSSPSVDLIKGVATFTGLIYRAVWCGCFNRASCPACLALMKLARSWRQQHA
jgi:hypothetical protein